MPRPPPPFTYTCTSCSWQKTTFPKSDALMVGRDCFFSCPVCEGDSVEGRFATQSEVMTAKLKQFFLLGRR